MWRKVTSISPLVLGSSLALLAGAQAATIDDNGSTGASVPVVDFSFQR